MHPGGGRVTRLRHWADSAGTATKQTKKKVQAISDVLNDYGDDVGPSDDGNDDHPTTRRHDDDDDNDDDDDSDDNDDGELICGNCYEDPPDPGLSRDMDFALVD